VHASHRQLRGRSPLPRPQKLPVHSPHNTTTSLFIFIPPPRLTIIRCTRTISQALFPTEGDHSLIVWVDVDWWNGTSGLPGVRDSWAWSTSCLYVVLPLELFPLLSIWVFNPQQRMKEVHICVTELLLSHTCVETWFADGRTRHR
jgi:hypothetical protein